MSNTQNTTMATTTLPVSALEPNDYNPNRMADERFAELVEEVRHLGRLPKPVVARPNGDDQYVIVDGEHGWRAAQEAGLTEIAVEVVEADDFEARRQTYKRNQHTKAERERLLERLNTTSQQDLAASLAERLFGEIYEETPGALRKVATRLARLEKTEILALDEFVTSEQKVRAWAAAIREIASMV